MKGERSLGPDPVDQGSADYFDDLLYDLFLISIGVLGKEGTGEAGAIGTTVLGGGLSTVG